MRTVCFLIFMQAISLFAGIGCNAEEGRDLPLYKELLGHWVSEDGQYNLYISEKVFLEVVEPQLPSSYQKQKKSMREAMAKLADYSYETRYNWRVVESDGSTLMIKRWTSWTKWKERPVESKLTFSADRKSFTMEKGLRHSKGGYMESKEVEKRESLHVRSFTYVDTKQSP